MTEIDYDRIVSELSKLTERTADEIGKEIQELMDKHGYNLMGAIATWKSDNKFLIAVDRLEYTVRVLAKESPRINTSDGKNTPVGNIHFAYNDPGTGTLMFNQTAVWNQDRIDYMYGAMDIGGCYKFKARLNDKGNLAWIRTVEPASGAPELIDIAGAPIASLVNVINKYEYVKGWVGRVITSQGIILGFEVDDLGGVPPLTVWFGGQYSKMSPEQVAEVADLVGNGAHVGAYGYISGTTAEVRMSASAVFFF